MRYLIDVGHPAHVHYFKHFAWDQQALGNEVLFSARDRHEIHALLKVYGFRFVSRGQGGEGALGKALYMAYADVAVLRAARSFQADVFVSFMSPYAAHASWALRKPHIGFNDTEHSRTVFRLYEPFVDIVLTPASYTGSFGDKQVRFPGLLELAYLHSERYEPQPSPHNELGIGPDQRYAVLRFLKHDAIHDNGVRGFSPEQRERLVEGLSERMAVFISAEGDLDPALEALRLPTSPERFHEVLRRADLFVTEAGTTATEAALLGTPVVRCVTFAESPLEPGIFTFLQAEGLVDSYHPRREEEAVDEALRIAADPASKREWKGRADRLVQEMIDPTVLLNWIAEEPARRIEALKRAGVAASIPMVVHDTSS